MDGVIEYTRVHFAAEEVYMESIGYADLDQHKETHKQLLAQVHGLREEAGSGDPDVLDRFMIFLETWLVGHIIGIDKRYGLSTEA